MANWSETTKHLPSEINNGKQYESKDRVSRESLNALAENSFFAVAKSEEANTNSLNAVSKASEALSKVTESLGSTIKVAGVAQSEVNFTTDPQTQINSLGTNIDGKPNLLDIYPIGSIYLTVATSTTGSVSPASFFGGSWERLPEGYSLWTASSGAGGTLNAGLPNIQGNISFANLFNENVEADGAFTVSAGTTASHTANNSNSRTRAVTTFDASKSNSIYGNSSTVQPPAYKVYAWKRVA